MNVSRPRRPGYTLIEILFALALAVLLLGALYVAVDVQLSLAQAGRNAVGRANLARSVFARLTADVAASTTLCDPGRYRRAAAAAAAAAAKSSATMGSSGTTTPAATTPAATTPAATTAPAASTATGTTTPTDISTGIQTSGQVVLTVGVIGNSTSLYLMMNRTPKETWTIPRIQGTAATTNIGIRPEDGTELVADQRAVKYWLVAPDGATPGGLARQETKIVTTDDALTAAASAISGDISGSTLPDGTTEQQYVIVPEALAVTFAYFDGTNWSDTWDSTQVGADGVTPQGPPRAIQVSITMDITNGANGTNPANIDTSDPNAVKVYTHVIAINTANGIPLVVPDPDASTTGSGTTTGNGTTTP